MTSFSARPLDGVRVLILEDEYLLADDLASALRQAGAEPVGPTGTVPEAEALAAKEQIDAAILDVNLRGEMASKFITRLAASNLPCVIVSGYGEDALPQSISQLCRLEKPVSPSVVVNSLAAQMARARAGA